MSKIDRELFIDFETFSVLDLQEVGTHVYAAHGSTDVWCGAFSDNDGSIGLWTRGDECPDMIRRAVAERWDISAFPANFERLIWHDVMTPRYGWPEPSLDQWRCLQTMALACSLPGKLEKLAETLDLPFKKDMAGRRLMLEMARPRKPRAGEDPNGVYLNDDPAKIKRLGEYCRNDPAVEREIPKRLPSLSKREQQLWQLDAQINDYGFYTDGGLLEAASRIIADADRDIQNELARITDNALYSTNQVAALQAWLCEHGCEVADLCKGTLKHALRRKGLSPLVRRVIELRLSAAHAAATKVESLLAWRGTDGRVRHSLRFDGAATGRWTGHGPQPQNFKRDSDGIDAKIKAIATGDLAYVAKCYPRPLEVVGDIARAMICAAPGHQLLIGDFSGIESRVTAWISGQQLKLDQWAKFDRTGDPKDEPYYMIGRTCGLLKELAREKGKVADLAFGFQGGITAWRKLAPENDNSTDDDIRRYQWKWRQAHPSTVRFWRDIDNFAVNAVLQPGAVLRYRQLTITYDGETFLRITLPSGRSLAYPFPRLDAGKFNRTAVFFKDNAAGKWVECHYGQGAYGGLWTENIVQGVARDLLAHVMTELAARGYQIVLHVHDEIVVEAPIGFGSLDEFRRILTTAPDWAKGLPLAAKVREGKRFSKPSAPTSKGSR